MAIKRSSLGCCVRWLCSRRTYNTFSQIVDASLRRSVDKGFPNALGGETGELISKSKGIIKWKTKKDNQKSFSVFPDMQRHPVFAAQTRPPGAVIYGKHGIVALATRNGCKIPFVLSDVCLSPVALRPSQLQLIRAPRPC